MLTTAEKEKMESIVKAMGIDEQQFMVEHIRTDILWNECEKRLVRSEEIAHKMQCMAREVLT